MMRRIKSYGVEEALRSDEFPEFEDQSNGRASRCWEYNRRPASILKMVAYGAGFVVNGVDDIIEYFVSRTEDSKKARIGELTFRFRENYVKGHTKLGDRVFAFGDEATDLNEYSDNDELSGSDGDTKVYKKLRVQESDACERISYTDNKVPAENVFDKVGTSISDLNVGKVNEEEGVLIKF